MNAYALLLEVFLKFFFLLTPFFVLSVFLTFTQELTPVCRRRLALKVTAAVLATCFVLLLCGNFLFGVFGITVDSFRIGAGILLFLSAVGLVQGKTEDPRRSADEDIAVVPLAIPITVGPATTGTLVVMSADSQDKWRMLITCLGLAAAVLATGGLLVLASEIKKRIGVRGIQIISKITGLVLAAMAAQMVCTGIRNIMRAP